MSTAIVSVPADSALLASLFALRDLAGEVAAIANEASEQHSTLVVDHMRGLLVRTLELLNGLMQLEPDPSVGDLCFAGGMELKRVLRELVSAQTDDARIVAAEAARRKIRRAIRATLEAAREAGVDVLGGEHQGRHQVADLACALAVRRLYARFRRGLRRPSDDSPDAVLAAVRYAGGAIATLVSAPDFADVRVSDRAVIRRLRERALNWARHDRGAVTGLHLLEDVWTCGDLLRGINQRQELQAHDAALIALALRGPDDSVAAWFALIDPLYGLDDAVDRILESAQAGGDLDRLVPDALVALASVQR
jgi:hypothetical protein